MSVFASADLGRRAIRILGVPLLGLVALTVASCGQPPRPPPPNFGEVLTAIGRPTSQSQALQGFRLGQKLPLLAERAAVNALCSTAADIVNEGSSPSALEVRQRLDGYMRQQGVPAVLVAGKLNQVQATINLAQFNGVYALRYAMACGGRRR